MEKTCNGCTTEHHGVNVPYVVHESAMARNERHNKRLWIVILVLIGALIASNLAWIIYESQFEVVEETNTIVEQDADHGKNSFIGGDYYGETEDKDN